MVTTTIQRTAQVPQVFRMLRYQRSQFSNWLHARSETFSALCGEDFTHKEVIIAHAACVLLIVACSVAELIEKGGAL